MPSSSPASSPPLFPPHLTTTNHCHSLRPVVRIILPLLVLLSLPYSGMSQLLFQLDGPQPCPTNPIHLMAQNYPQYIYSPYDEHRNYPPDTDCQFLIEAIDSRHRIHLSVLESELEEALFTDCNDYISIRDREGNGTNTREVIRWCGQDYPAAISSASDSVLVHFHSDSVIQKRGFNISFVQFALPGCPPEWKQDESSPFCYKHFSLPHIMTWYDAQKECNFERSNLATFRDEKDYSFVTAEFSQTHSLPWIGYSNANVEGVFETADRSSPLWPENFPLKQENDVKDCVYLDWSRRDRMVPYEVEDCRIRKPFLCKMKKDGSEIPIFLPSGMIRHGFRDFSIDYTLLIGVIILLLLVLIIACILYHKYRERANRIVNVDLNQRLVQQHQSGTSSAVGSRQMLGPTGGSHKPLSAEQKAKEKTREERRRERDANREHHRRYEQMAEAAAGRNGPKPFESRDSNTSFPLATFQGFSRTIQQIAGEQREEGAVAGRNVPPMERTTNGGGGGESPTESPRISLSPNQPQMEERRKAEEEEDEREEEYRRRRSDGGKQRKGAEEEEEMDRHNMGYEPDSEEDEEGGRGIGQEEERRERGRMDYGQERRRREYGHEHEEYEQMEEGGIARERREEDHLVIQMEHHEEAGQILEKEEEAEKGTAETEHKEADADGMMALASTAAGAAEGTEILGKFAQIKPAPGADHPLRQMTIEMMPQQQKKQKEEDEQQQQQQHPIGSMAPQREETMFSGTGTLGTGTAGGTRIRSRRKSFDRPPPVGPLDSVSAISLDEFWQQNQK